MKRNWLVAMVTVFFFASCGDNSSENTYSDKDTSTTTVTSVEPTVTPPVYNPPDNVRVDFQTKYRTAANVSWSVYKPYDRINWEWTGWPSMDTTYYAVNYTVDNRPFWGWYDRNSNWIGSTSVLADSTALPEAVKKAIASNYSGYRIVSIDEENDKSRTAYEIKLEKGDVRARILIDSKGKILKKDTKA